ncbi:MAG: alpha/beta hydrolase fold domain-containing protein, partial [Crocinitomicaceae bacterium]
MKQTITLIFLMLGITSFAQPCNGGRYASNIFTNVDVTSDIQYGQNLDLAGSNVNLLLDFYEPNGDTETARPLILWVHGGSFIGGSKTDGDMVTLATDFAEKGFACASIDYRLGLNFPPDSASAIRALLRAVQDLKAAVRFFYKDRATTNTYKIDTTKIFLGGTSAGALTALHYA